MSDDPDDDVIPPYPTPVQELAQFLYTGFGAQRDEKVNELAFLIRQAVVSIIDERKT